MQGSSASKPRGEVIGLVVSNLAKFMGLAIGFNEAILGPGRPYILLYAFAIWAGVQAAEDVVLKIFERTFGER